jgi:hypothetical protein
VSNGYTKLANRFRTASIFNRIGWRVSCKLVVKAMQKVFMLGFLAVALAPLPGSTLQQLSLDDMIRLSTVIVHGKAQQTVSSYSGSIIYTHYQVHVSETLKGKAASQLDIAVPGGAASRMQQIFAGAPTLAPGQDYVLFLWTSKSGLTQIIGLSQGMFVVTPNASGQSMVTRAASSERIVNTVGEPVSDSAMQMLLSDLRTQIQKTLGTGAAK